MCVMFERDAACFYVRNLCGSRVHGVCLYTQCVGMPTRISGCLHTCIYCFRATLPLASVFYLCEDRGI